MAKMGLSVKDDPRKVVDIAGRTWGSMADGLALSVLLKRKEDIDELSTVTVAIHNSSTETQRLTTRGWLNFFKVSVISLNGEIAPPTPYGAQLMQPERQPAPLDVVLAPGEATEADIPIGSMYQLRHTEYRVQAVCESPAGNRIVSNEIRLLP